MADRGQDPMPPVANRLRHGVTGGDPSSAPRCGARTRSGAPCRQPAMTNGRCRMHGGESTGPCTAGGLARLSLARTKHGNYGKEMRALRGLIRALRGGTKRLMERA